MMLHLVQSSFVLKFDSRTSSFVYPHGQVFGQNNVMVDWTSQDRGRLSGGKTECVSNSILENSILAMADKG